MVSRSVSVVALAPGVEPYISLPMGKQKPTDNLPMGDEAMVYYAISRCHDHRYSLVSVCSAARLSLFLPFPVIPPPTVAGYWHVLFRDVGYSLVKVL
jgi:hypothetical protein